MSVKKVKKAIIPAAGCGTRFMPITKSVPKEMLVLVDKPALHYIVEECANSGITDVRIVVREGKESIVNYFTPSPSDTPELKNLLEKVNVSFAWQKTPRGTGDTIMLCRDFVKDEPFAVLFGDDVVISDKPCTGQLIAAYEKTGRSVVGVQTVPDDEAVRYGVIEKGADYRKTRRGRIAVQSLQSRKIRAYKRYFRGNKIDSRKRGRSDIARGRFHSCPFGRSGCVRVRRQTLRRRQ